MSEKKTEKSSIVIPKPLLLTAIVALVIIVVGIIILIVAPLIVLEDCAPTLECQHNPYHSSCSLQGCSRITLWDKLVYDFKR